MIGVVVLFALLQAASGANILTMLLLPTHSHTHVFLPIIEALAERGHNITLYIAIPPKAPIPNVKVIEAKLDILRSFTAKELTGLTPFERVAYPFKFMTSTTDEFEKFLGSDVMQSLIHDNTSKFDLVMLETFAIHELFLPLGHKFEAPVINLDTHLPMIFGSYVTGNPYILSYVPSVMLPFTHRMTFTERSLNALIAIMKITAVSLYSIPKLEEFKKTFYTYSSDIPPLAEMLRNTTLTLSISNSHILYPRPLHKNVIEVDTQIPRKLAPLPQDLQKFMDDADEGVIYFTMGSYLISNDLTPEIIDVLTSTFGKLKQRVLWKWNGEDVPPNLPENVRLSKWFPQTTILNHTNCRLFITHGGYNSYFETMYFGVPILGIPLVSDQVFNVMAAVDKGVGLMTEYRDLTADDLLLKIETILRNSTFKENAMRISELLREFPGGVDNAVFWVEHVIKHRGAPHLRPAVLDLYLYEYLMLDVFLVFLLSALTPVVFTYCICRKCCVRKPKMYSKYKKNN